MQGLSMAMRSGGADIRVFGLADDGLGDDRASWSDIPVHAARISGPRAFGYAGDLYQAVLSSQLDVLHVLCSLDVPERCLPQVGPRNPSAGDRLGKRLLRSLGARQLALEEADCRVAVRTQAFAPRSLYSRTV